MKQISHLCFPVRRNSQMHSARTSGRRSLACRHKISTFHYRLARSWSRSYNENISLFVPNVIDFLLQKNKFFFVQVVFTHLLDE